MIRVFQQWLTAANDGNDGRMAARTPSKEARIEERQVSLVLMVAILVD
jgi:hypothetical protein